MSETGCPRCDRGEHGNQIDHPGFCDCCGRRVTARDMNENWIRVWEDSVGDSGQAPTDNEIIQFAEAVLGDAAQQVRELAASTPADTRVETTWARRTMHAADLIEDIRKGVDL